jgi:hypothetical protein
LGLKDLYTGYGVIIPIKTKDEAHAALVSAIKQLEALSPGNKVQCIRFDGGGEFISAALKQELEDMRIVIEPSTPYLSSLNGVAERFNRTTLDKVRSMLADSGLHPWNWPEAAKAAAYVGNRIATKEDKTPWEKLTGHKPSVKHLRVWGAPCMVHTPLKLQDDKLAPRAEAGRMMGYKGDNTNGWRVLMGSKIYVRGGHIDFNEEQGAKPFAVDEHAPSPAPSSPFPSPSPNPLTPTPPVDPDVMDVDLHPEQSPALPSWRPLFAEGPPALPSERPIRTRPDGQPLFGRIPGSTSLQAFYLSATRPHLDFEPANWTQATECDEWEEWMEAAKEELEICRPLLRCLGCLA